MKGHATTKLMVLENKPTQLEMLEFFLRRIGITNLRTANSYSSTIDLFKTCVPDITLLDIELALQHPIEDKPALSSERLWTYVKMF